MHSTGDLKAVWLMFDVGLHDACYKSWMLRACIGSLNKLPANEINVHFPSHHFLSCLIIFYLHIVLSDNTDISPMICFFLNSALVR